MCAHHAHTGSGRGSKLLASVDKWSQNIHSKFQVCSYHSFKVISVLKPKFGICAKCPHFSDPVTYYYTCSYTSFRITLKFCLFVLCATVGYLHLRYFLLKYLSIHLSVYHTKSMHCLSVCPLSVHQPTYVTLTWGNEALSTQCPREGCHWSLLPLCLLR